MTKLELRFLTYLLEKAKSWYLQKPYSQIDSSFVDCCDFIIETLEEK
jgi:hypothetical protein